MRSDEGGGFANVHERDPDNPPGLVKEGTYTRTWADTPALALTGAFLKTIKRQRESLS